MFVLQSHSCYRWKSISFREDTIWKCWQQIRTDHRQHCLPILLALCNPWLRGAGNKVIRCSFLHLFSYASISHLWENKYFSTVFMSEIVFEQFLCRQIHLWIGLWLFITHHVMKWVVLKCQKCKYFTKNTLKYRSDIRGTRGVYLNVCTWHI